jgi:hypothetical protein
MSRELELIAQVLSMSAGSPTATAAHVVSMLSEHGYSIVPNPRRGEPPEAPELRRTADSLERIAHWKWPDDRDECPFTAKGLRKHADALDEWEPVIAAAAEEDQ